VSAIASEHLALIEARLAGVCAVPDGTPIVVACSGGADSVYLVHALGALQARWPVQSVAFVDHGLRPVGAEAAASREAARSIGARWNRCEVHVPTSGNLQEGARVARYRALAHLVGDSAVVATGHTRDDQAETVLQRLMRGAGLRGLRAIAPRDGHVVRPLLDVDRTTTRSAGLPFAEDPTNGTDAYQRNRLRHDVLPWLEADSGGAIGHLAALAEQASSEIALIDALADALDLDTLDLGGLEPGTVATVLRWRVRRELPPTVRPSEAATRQAAALLARRASCAETSLGAGWSARADHGSLSFVETTDLRDRLVAPSPGSYRCAHATAEVIRAADNPPLEPLEGILETRLLESSLTWPLTLLREPERGEGDRPWVLRDGAGAILWRTDVPSEATAGDLIVRMKVAP
jgi:tRNA(Ile)-lysidine synthase